MTDHDHDPTPQDEGPQDEGPQDPATMDGLDALLVRAAARAPAPLPDALRARLLADALAQMPAPARPARASAREPGILAQLWQTLGGSPGLAGLTAAGIAGLWIGAAAPGPVAGLPQALWQGAALVGSDTAGWDDDALAGFDDDSILALMDLD